MDNTLHCFIYNIFSGNHMDSTGLCHELPNVKIYFTIIQSKIQFPLRTSNNALVISKNGLPKIMGI